MTPFSGLGGGGSGAARISSSLQIVAEVSGCTILGMPQDESGDSLFYGSGPRWTPRAARRFSPYTQALMGGRKVTYEIADPAKQEYLMGRWKNAKANYPYPKRTDWVNEKTEHGFSLALGGGFDVVVNRAWAWRVANLEYTRSWLPDIDTMCPQEGLRFSSGVVLRIGTW